MSMGNFALTSWEQPHLDVVRGGQELQTLNSALRDDSGAVSVVGTVGDHFTLKHSCFEPFVVSEI